MVHKDVRKAALIFKDSWQTFPKLLGDIASGMAEEGYEKRCPHNCGQHVSSAGCFSCLYYLVRLSACILVHFCIR